MQVIRRLSWVVGLMVSALALMMQIGPQDAAANLCEWIIKFSGSCPSYVSERQIPHATPLVLYGLASLCIAWAFFPLLKQHRFWLKPNEPETRNNPERGAEVGRRAKQLSQDIYRFLRERETEAPAVNAGLDMLATAELRRQYTIRTGPIFMDRYGVQMAGVFDELGALQIDVPLHLRHQAQYRIDEVAFFLAQNGDRLVRQAQAEPNHVAR